MLSLPHLEIAKVQQNTVYVVLLNFTYLSYRRKKIRLDWVKTSFSAVGLIVLQTYCKTYRNSLFILFKSAVSAVGRKQRKTCEVYFFELRPPTGVKSWYT